MKWPWSREKRTSPPSSESYCAKVSEFWRWWQSESSRILDSVDADGGVAIQPEVSEAVNSLYPSFGWVFGLPGSEQARHSFTLTPEGCGLKKHFVDRWLEEAPDLPEWTFYPSRQPNLGRQEPFSIGIGNVRVSSESLWISPTVDEDHREVDIVVWSPSFAELGDKERETFLFLFLDDAIGEEKAERCIGRIQISDDELDRSLPAAELREYLDQVFEQHEWNKDEVGKVYEFEEYQGDYPRGDIFIGSTSTYELVRYYDRSPFKHSSAQTGGEFGFVQLPNTLFPDDQVVEFRGMIAAEIDEALAPGRLGYTVGGATGTDAFYIDYVSFDKPLVRELIGRALSKRTKDYQIFSFVR